jgi:hypothetical protein
MTVTVEENIRQRIEGRKKWKEANPGLDWYNPEIRNDDPKIYITKELLESVAYRSLSRVAMLLYQDFLAKRIFERVRKRWVFENNGNIAFPFREALEKGYSKNQFRNAIDELQLKGLIDIKHQGRGGRKPLNGTSDMSLYWIDNRWEDYGTENFKPARNPRRKDTRHDRGWAKLMNDPKQKKAILKKRRKKQL